MKSMKMLCAALSLSALVISSVAMAADDTPTWEFSGSANASFSHTSVDQGSGSTYFKIGTTADYFVLPALEVGVDTLFNLGNSQGSTDNTLFAMVGPTYNFMGPVVSSFFVSARAGIYNFNAAGYGYTAFSWEAYVGKRFELASHVSWSPEVGVSGTAGATIENVISIPSTTTWVVTPFRFSVLF